MNARLNDQGTRSSGGTVCVKGYGLMRDQVVTRRGEPIQSPPLVRALLANPASGWIWLIPRLWLGYQWIEASSHKIGNPAWMRTGEALKGFWTAAVLIPKTGHPAISFHWYRTFLQMLLDSHAYSWFAKLIAVGELAVGIALLLGAFSGIAAFFGGVRNWNFMMSGSAGVNPMLFLISVGLVIAWRVCGYIGADYFLLRRIGTPWQNPQIDLNVSPEDTRDAAKQWELQPSTYRYRL